MYIVGFNGPPYSGKDTMARFLAEHMDSQGVSTPVIEASLSTPLRRIAYAMVGRTYTGDHDDYTKFKETHFPQFGQDGRWLMIAASEHFLKSEYGESIMAKMLMAELPPHFDGLVLVRDSGFQCEVNPLIDVVGEDNLYIARVHRPDCDFTNDSREWVRARREGDYENTADLAKLRVEAGRLYGRLVNNLGWKL